MERLRQQQEALRAAHQRNEKDLASFPQVLVEHPRYGRAVVRGGSNCQALEQAALLWGMTPQDLGDETRVWQLAGYQAQHPELGELAELSMTREELAALAREKVPETVPGELPALEELLPLVKCAEVLAQKYDVVVTNPPYMGSSSMSDSLLLYVKREYPDERYDLSTVMMNRCIHFANNTGFIAMINIPVWMFISSYTALRKKLIKNNTIFNMLHLGRGVFGSDFGTTAFVINKSNFPDYFAVYRRLHTEVGNVDPVDQKEKWFFEGFGYYTNQKRWYERIPTTPIAYWLSENAINLFATQPSLRNIADPRQGLATGNDELFLRQWQEVDYSQIGFGYTDTETFQESANYAPFNKGGAFRKWYGNNALVIRFSKENYDLLLKSGNHLPSRQFYFKPGITWTALTAGDFSGRYCSDGFVFAGKGPMCFPNRREDIYYLLGFLNSKLTSFFMKVFSSTTDFNQGPMRDLPLMMCEAQIREQIESIVKNNILISRTDWDSYETSWDFKRNPLV